MKKAALRAAFSIFRIRYKELQTTKFRTIRPNLSPVNESPARIYPRNGSMVTTTRRFICRPATVSLPAIG